MLMSFQTISSINYGSAKLEGLGLCDGGLVVARVHIPTTNIKV
jgi:hypothetical protein